MHFERVECASWDLERGGQDNVGEVDRGIGGEGLRALGGVGFDVCAKGVGVGCFFEGGFAPEIVE